MTALSGLVIEKTEGKGVRITYVNRELTKWWNGRRHTDDTALFTGFYWSCGTEQAGPFKTRSAALRDAYYRHVLNREPPAPAFGRRDKVKLRLVKAA